MNRAMKKDEKSKREAKEEKHTVQRCLARSTAKCSLERLDEEDEGEEERIVFGGETELIFARLSIQHICFQNGTI